MSLALPKEKPPRKRGREPTTKLGKRTRARLTPQSWSPADEDELIALYKEMPLWTYRDLASHFCLGGALGYVSDVRTEDCARRLHELYQLSPERFGIPLPPPPAEDGVGMLGSRDPASDATLARLQGTLCGECIAMDLGRAHLMATLEYKDYEDTSREIRRSLAGLRSGARTCPCCQYVYTHFIERLAARQQGPRMETWAPERITLIITLHAKSYEHQLHMQPQGGGLDDLKVDALRLVHLYDWVPFRYVAPSPWAKQARPPRANKAMRTATPHSIPGLVPEEPSIAEVATRVKSWLTDCETSHHKCRRFDFTDPPLPKRVLLIRKDQGRILVQLEDCLSQTGRYVALSYVWGNPEQFSFCTATEASLRAGLNINVLSRTVQEAIELTYLLGFHYLWIDALCIRQDSRADWEVQSAQMAQFYGKADLTLLAARSPGVDMGFLKPTIPSTAYCGTAKYNGIDKPVFITHCERSRFGTKRQDPLDLRGWTLQEEYLSQRKVKFSSKQMEWHCRSTSRDEQDRSPSNSTHPAFAWLGNAPNETRNSKHWRTIVVDYSKRKLTVVEDRLPALSGLASLYAAHTGLEYLAGLWSGPGLVSLLMWRLSDDALDHPMQTLPSMYLAPSWSWVSADCRVTFQTSDLQAGKHKYIASVVDHSITLKGANPFGEVTNGYLDLRVPAIPTTLDAIMTLTEPPPPRSDYEERVRYSMTLQELFPGYRMEPFSEYSPRFYLDHHQLRDDLAVYCLVLGYQWKETRGDGMFGILVMPVSDDECSFRRVGVFTKLPHFRTGDKDLDMTGLCKKRSAEHGEYIEADRQAFRMYWPRWRSPRACDKVYQAALQRRDALFKGLQQRANTLPGDVEFTTFRII